MESNFDPLRKVSLGIFGTAPEAFHHAIPFTVRQLEFESIPDFFLIAPNLDRKEIEEILQKLDSLNVYRSRIIFLVSAQDVRSTSEPFFGQFLLTNSETAEEFKFRVANFFELQRISLLNEFCEKIRPQAPNCVPPAVNIAHSLCLQLQLAPEEHIQSLHKSLEALDGKSPPKNLPETISNLAISLFRLMDQPNLAREELKNITAQLPFRLRTEIRAAVEKTFERIWRGNSHAA